MSTAILQSSRCFAGLLAQRAAQGATLVVLLVGFAFPAVSRAGNMLFYIDNGKAQFNSDLFATGRESGSCLELACIVILKPPTPAPWPGPVTFGQTDILNTAGTAVLATISETEHIDETAPFLAIDFIAIQFVATLNPAGLRPPPFINAVIGDGTVQLARASVVNWQLGSPSAFAPLATGTQDDVYFQIGTAVPEPATLPMMSLGALLLALVAHHSSIRRRAESPR